MSPEGPRAAFAPLFVARARFLAPAPPAPHLLPPARYAARRARVRMVATGGGGRAGKVGGGVEGEAAGKGARKVPRKRVVSEETRRKIAFAMLGQHRSEEMRQKVSEKLKGRVPWNKGKKLSPETRARMSEARFGRDAWNKGRKLTEKHRNAIAASSAALERAVSSVTRKRMRMARRRPGDAIVAGTGTTSRDRAKSGSYPLVDTADINDYVTLRRELRVWSDSFADRIGRRPSLADVRRVAPIPVMRKFERYVCMRNSIRGLASDVYGAVDPKAVPVVVPGTVSSGPQNNNAQTYVRVTKHGNPRLVSAGDEDAEYSTGPENLLGSREDMWDIYDRPVSRGDYTSGFQADNSLMGVHELGTRPKDELSADDYRMIGKYRLMESIDINHYVALRKELEEWSAAFRKETGRTPALSDVRHCERPILYYRFCQYLDMRDRMNGLVREVYRTEIDDLETFEKVNAEGKSILHALRNGQVPPPAPRREGIE